MATVSRTINDDILAQLAAMSGGKSTAATAPSAPVLPEIKKPAVLVLKDGERAFSEVFGITPTLKDFGFIIH